MYVEKKSSFPDPLFLFEKVHLCICISNPKRNFKNLFHCRGKPCVVSPTEQGVGGSQDKPGKRGKWERRRGGCRSDCRELEKSSFPDIHGVFAKICDIFLKIVFPGPEPVYGMSGSMCRCFRAIPPVSLI